MPEEILRMGSGDPYLPSPENVREAAKKAIDGGYTHYLNSSEFRHAVAEKLKGENKIDVDPESGVVITSGCLNALFSSILTIVNPGDEVLMPHPYFPRFRQFTLTARGIPAFYSLIEEEGWRPDLSEIEGRVNPKTRLLIVNSPHNPTGGVLDLGEVRCDGLGMRLLRVLYRHRSLRADTKALELMGRMVGLYRDQCHQ